MTKNELNTYLKDFRGQKITRSELQSLTGWSFVDVDNFLENFWKEKLDSKFFTRAYYMLGDRKLSRYEVLTERKLKDQATRMLFLVNEYYRTPLREKDILVGNHLWGDISYDREYECTDDIACSYRGAWVSTDKDEIETEVPYFSTDANAIISLFKSQGIEFSVKYTEGKFSASSNQKSAEGTSLSETLTDLFLKIKDIDENSLY